MGSFSDFLLLLHLFLLLTAAKVLPLCVSPDRSGLFVWSRDTDPQQLMETHLLSAPCDDSHQRPVQKFLFLPGDKGNKICYLRLLSYPRCLKPWGSRWQFDGPEHRTGNWLPLFCYFAGIQSRNNFSGEVSPVLSELQKHRLLWQKLFGQYNLSQEALASGADAGPLCCEEVAPTAPPSPAVCGFSGLLAARGGNALAAQPASLGLADLVLRCWKSVRASDSTLGAGPSKTCQRTSPGPRWLLLLTRGLYFSSF